MMIMQDKSSELATSHQVAVARAADERASQAEPSASASAEQEVEALRATRLKLAGVIAALKAGFENLRQGFLVLDDDWRIMMFNERINEIVGCPPGVGREGAQL